LAALEASDPRARQPCASAARASIERIAPDFPATPLPAFSDEGDARRTALRCLADDEPCPALDPATGLCDLLYRAPHDLPHLSARPCAAAPKPSASCELCFHGATDAEIAACEVRDRPSGIESELLGELESATGPRGYDHCGLCPDHSVHGLTRSRCPQRRGGSPRKEPPAVYLTEARAARPSRQVAGPAHWLARGSTRSTPPSGATRLRMESARLGPGPAVRSVPPSGSRGLLFHRTAVTGCPHPEARLECVIQTPDRNGRHPSTIALPPDAAGRICPPAASKPEYSRAMQRKRARRLPARALRLRLILPRRPARFVSQKHFEL